ncbi:fimbrial protein [Serratia marcescens]|uniref:fimbrial protein n=2 Tax=Serratia marcescens TaxID=615 RepID=UPI00374183A2|nr:type 1 fimbrial protein [Serratia marcescens]
MMIATVKKVPLLALFSAAMLAPPLHAADGNINVTGRVVENACLVAAESKNMVVDFGELAGQQNSHFLGLGLFKPITLLDCPSGANQVKVRFEGTAISEEGFFGKDYIFAPDAGSVSNVGFRVIERESWDSVKVNGDTKPYNLMTGAGSKNDIMFIIEVVKVDMDKPIALGQATGNIQFSILYN